MATVGCAPGEPEHVPDTELVRVLRIPGWHCRPLRLSCSPAFRRALTRYCREHGTQIIQSHGLWTQPNHAAARAARDLGLPLVVSVHGMLEPWAWRHRAWKKRPIWWLWQRRALIEAAVIRVTARQEAEGVRARGLANPIAVIPNGVELPPEAGVILARTGSGERTALFLSRIHPVKGLLDLVQAWDKLRPAGWRVLVAGPDEENHRAVVDQAISERRLEGHFEFLGPVGDERKWEVFGQADLFVLPTKSENFGIAIAEALAAGVPVITTKAAPWQELESHRCGWWVDVGVEPLAAALREATAASPDVLREMGLRGRELVRERYSWPKIAEDMKAVYEWVLGRGPRPGCVEG